MDVRDVRVVEDMHESESDIVVGVGFRVFGSRRISHDRPRSKVTLSIHLRIPPHPPMTSYTAAFVTPTIR